MSEDTYKHDVFISHSGDSSRPIVDQLATWLEKDGEIKCWYAPRDLDNTGAGKEYADELAAAILHARCMVVVLDDEALQSKWVLHEVQQADDQKKRIIPFVIHEISLKNTGLSLMLNSRHFISAYPNPEDKFPILLKNLKQLLGYDVYGRNIQESAGRKRVTSNVDLDYNNGMAFLELNQDKEAFLSFFQSAKKGNINAANKLAEIALKNCKNPQFLEETIWEQIKEIANSGEGYAELLMHFKYYSTAPQDELSVEYLRRSIEKIDSPIAFLQLGICYGWGLGVAQSDVLAKKYYEIALEKGCAIAYRYLGQLYLYGGSGVDKDLEKAEEYLKKGVEMGVERCYVYLLQLYAKQGVYEKALELAQHMIDSHIKGGYTLMGDYFIHCASDVNNAEEWYEKACKQEEDMAWGRLAALCYSNGKKEDANQYALKGYSRGDSVSFNILAQLCEDREDFERAWNYYQQSIQKFGTGYDGLAKLYLVHNYHPDSYQLSDLKRDLKLSVQLQNENSIKYMLEVLLIENGKDGQKICYENLKDIPESYDILCIGVKEGDDSCLYMYGRLLLESEGEMYNPFRGIDYVETAAEKGNKDAIIYAFNYYKDVDSQKLSEISEKIVNGKMYVKQVMPQVVDFFLARKEPTLNFVDWLYRSLRILAWEDVTMFYNCFRIFRHVVQTSSEDVKSWLAGKVDEFIQEYEPDKSTSVLMVPFYAYLFGQKLCNGTANERIITVIRQIINIEDDVLFMSKIPYFKSAVQLLWPDYMSEKILNGDFSNERDLRIFYGCINETLPDTLELGEVIENATSDVNGCFIDMNYSHGFNTTKTELFFSVYEEVLTAYRNLVKRGLAQQIEDSFNIQPPYVCCSIEDTMNYCLNSLKMLILSRDVFGDKWPEIVSQLSDKEYLEQMSKTFEDKDANNLLCGYSQLSDARNEIIVFDMQLEHASCKCLVDVINAVTEELNNKNISHEYQTATEDCLPEFSRDIKDSMFEFVASMRKYMEAGF